MAPPKRYFVVAALVVALFTLWQLDLHRSAAGAKILRPIFGEGSAKPSVTSVAPSNPPKPIETAPPKADEDVLKTPAHDEAKPKTPTHDKAKPTSALDDALCNPPGRKDAELDQHALSLLQTKGDTRIGEVSVHIGSAVEGDVYKRALKTHLDYAQYHNYTFHDLRKNLIDDTMWNKQAFILSIMLREMQKPEGERLEWLFWFDGDSMVLNYCIPLQIYLPTTDSVHVLIAADDFGINAGAFGIRVSGWSIDFLTTVLGYRFTMPDVQLTFAEQTAMDIVSKTPQFEGGLVKVPNRWFNAYKHPSDNQDQQVQEGDLLVHFPGDHPREKFMLPWLEKLEQNKTDWVMDWRVGKLGTQIVEFWKDHEKEKNKGQVGAEKKD